MAALRPLLYGVHLLWARMHVGVFQAPEGVVEYHDWKSVAFLDLLLRRCRC